jgi:hypothetical protein
LAGKRKPNPFGITGFRSGDGDRLTSGVADSGDLLISSLAEVARAAGSCFAYTATGSRV